ncbi:MAG: hypothetical protein NXI16_13290 [Alphaproteobacteria bacterium]|nr:hypothetical protein [Alphaproteobacteria bacterium]
MPRLKTLPIGGGIRREVYFPAGRRPVGGSDPAVEAGSPLMARLLREEERNLAIADWLREEEASLNRRPMPDPEFVRLSETEIARSLAQRASHIMKEL